MGETEEGGAPAGRVVGTGAVRVVLRELAPADVPPPAVADGALPTGRVGRYRILGEVGRGGVGVILKTEDADLGRPVAMKVLRGTHAARAGAIERFVEEAQIGGQLQHPGVVPVYEMGLVGGDLPYFTMKFVKGRTLAALLEERRGVAPDRTVFEVFERVCQTIAYAHSLGVVHRDLKPSNVMIGGFGEVYVVDWGLAKVLGRAGAQCAPGRDAARPVSVATVRSGDDASQTQAGSVFGTPAYMPPEQARGSVESVDERADVFALGAVLCEILTGAPPYEGRDSDVLVRAGRADLEPARERIRRSGADPAIAALCLDCLSPAREDRPADAAGVAERLGRHFASVEERSRTAEVAAAEDRARAAEDVRVRRLARVLSGTLAAAIVAGAGAFVWIAAHATEARRAAERGARLAIEEAVLQRGDAARASDPAAWRTALEAARRAVAAARETGDDLRARAAGLEADAEEGVRAAERAARAKARDAAMEVRIDDITTRWADDNDIHAYCERIAAAFREYGIDVAAMRPQEAADLIRASAISERLVDAVSHWSWIAERGDRQDEHLAVVADAAEPTPWVRRLRDAKDLASLRALADEVETTLPSRRVIRSLAAALAAAGDPDRGARLAEAWIWHHPDDFLTVQTCSDMQRQRVPVRAEEAVRWVTAAVALRPTAGASWVYLGIAKLDCWDVAGAHDAWQKAIELAPDNAYAHGNMAYWMLLQGDAKGAEREARRAVALDGADGMTHASLALALWRNEDYDGARDEAARCIALAPGDYLVRVAAAIAHAGCDDLAKAVAEARECVRLRPGFPRGWAFLSQFAYLAGDGGTAIRAGAESIRRDPDSHEGRGALCRARLGAGDVAGALTEGAEAVRRRPQEAETHLAHGLALQASGRAADALAEFRAAQLLQAWNAEPSARIAWTLLRTGDVDGAAAALRDANGAQMLFRPETRVYREELRRVERARSRVPLLERYLRGEAEPRSLDDRIAFAHLAASRGLFARSAALLEECVGAGAPVDDELSLAGWSPGTVAALAGTGAGTDADTTDDAARAQWRRTALAWLNADLARWRRGVKEGAPDAASTMRWRVQREWRWYPDLLPLRTDAGLAALPESERDEWRAFWADADALLARTRD